MASSEFESQEQASACSTGMESVKEDIPQARCKSPGSPIGEDACPICLGRITDKAAAGSCLHNFCLVCLKEWAKQKPVCPLCKQSFDRIFYNIKSESDYKEWKVPPKEPVNLSVSFQEYMNSASRRFFGYRTTNFPGASRLRRPFVRHRNASHDAIPSGARIDRALPYYNHRGSSMFRLSIYLNNVWVQPVSDVTGTYRVSSPQLYREQPALTHRLVPWVNRELAALLPPQRISIILTEIMELIERHPINSREFCRAMRPHLGPHAVHFLHEFYCFARSPYDMVGHDNASHYIPRYELINEESADISDEDEIVEVNSTGEPINPLQPLDLSHNLHHAGVSREETIGNDGSVIISSDSSSSDEAPNSSSLPQDYFDTHNPEPPHPVDSLETLVHKASSNKKQAASSSNLAASLDQNISEPGPSGVSQRTFNAPNMIKKEHSDSESTDECTVVEVLKAKKDRTPEVINLSSESEGEYPASEKAKTHWKKRMTKEAELKSKKVPKRPKLDRTSFSLHFSGTLECHENAFGSCSSVSEMSSSSQRYDDDHTYCTESTSSFNHISTNSRSDSEEHADIEERIYKSSNKRSARRLIVDSDEEGSASSRPKITKTRSQAVHMQASTSRHPGASTSYHSGKEHEFKKKKNADLKKRGREDSKARHKDAHSSDYAFRRANRSRPLKKWVCREKKFYYYSPLVDSDSGDSSSSESSDSSTTTSSSSSSASSSSSSSSSRSSSCTSSSSGSTSDDSYKGIRRQTRQKIFRSKLKRESRNRPSASDEDNLPLSHLSKKSTEQLKSRVNSLRSAKNVDKKRKRSHSNKHKYR